METFTVRHDDRGIMLSSATSLARNIRSLLHPLRLDVAYTEHFLHRIHYAHPTEYSRGHEGETIRLLVLECSRFSLYWQLPISRKRTLHLGRCPTLTGGYHRQTIVIFVSRKDATGCTSAF